PAVERGARVHAHAAALVDAVRVQRAVVVGRARHAAEPTGEVATQVAASLAVAIRGARRTDHLVDVARVVTAATREHEQAEADEELHTREFTGAPRVAESCRAASRHLA